MSGSAPPNQLTEEEQEKEYRGLTASEIKDIEALQSDFAQDKQTTLSAGIASIFGTVAQGIKIHDSGKLLEDLDLEALQKDPLYRQRAISAVQLHDRYGRVLQRNQTKKDQVSKVRNALKQVRELDRQQDQIRARVSSQYTSYFNEMKTSYGLTDDQVKKLTEKARITAKEEGISVQEAMRNEAKKTVLQPQATKEIEEENKGVKLSEKEKKEKITARVKKLDEEKGGQFVQRTKIAYENQEKLPMKRAYNSTVGPLEKDFPKKIKPDTKKQIPLEKKPEPQSAQPAPPSSPGKPKPPPSRPVQPTQVPVFANFRNSFSNFTSNIRANIVAHLPPIPAFVTNIGTKIGESGLGSLLGGLTKEGGLASKLGGLGGKLGGLGGKLANLAGKLGKAIPGLGQALLARDLAKLFTFGASEVVLKFVIGGIVSAAVLLPLLLVLGGASLFDSHTASDPEMIPSSGVQTYNWNTFQQAFLNKGSIKENQQADWGLFTETFLSPHQKMSEALGLNSDRHNNMKK